MNWEQNESPISLEGYLSVTFETQHTCVSA